MCYFMNQCYSFNVSRIVFVEKVHIQDQFFFLFSSETPQLKVEYFFLVKYIGN